MGMFKRFKADQSGTTAVMFGLALLPMMGVAGAAIDYSRAADIHSRMQRAADAAALSLTREPDSASKSALSAKAQAVFDQAFRAEKYVAATPVTVNRTGAKITVTAGGRVTNAFLQVMGIPTTAVGATSTVNSTRPDIELALVLDNTGSMGDNVGGRTKMSWLQDQAKVMLDHLSQLATTPDKVKVSVVPFDTEVRLDANSYRSKQWFRDGNREGVAQGWDGYVFDRYGSFAKTDDVPNAYDINSRFPTLAQSEYGRQELAAMRPLTSLYSSNPRQNANYDALVKVVEGMKPRGNTNIALGVMWGLATLSKSEPFAETAGDDVKKYMIVLTDGLNTMSHIDGSKNTNVSKIDAATSAACSLAKAKPAKGEAIEVFTIRLVEGNELLLQGCASAPTKDHYFNVQQPRDLKAAFEKILETVMNPRITS